MKGLPFKAVKSITKLIEGKFDFLALNFLGMIPKKTGKTITFNTNKDSLVFLYLKALGHKKMTPEERNLLKVILNVASGYMDSLKDRTKSKVINSVDAYMRSEKMSNRVPKVKEIKSIVDKEMTSAKKHLELIANSESNKSVNYGMAMKIGRMAKRRDDEDPTVFFMVTIDDVTGSEEFRLHLLPDRITPRVWKLSEIGSEYHKKGDNNPKFAGLHPNCFVGNSGVNVLTEKDGYKNIKDVEIGDRVLTHTGKFKQVLNTLSWYDKKYYGNFIEIKYKTFRRDGEEVVTLKVTPDHEFMTQRGWVRAEELKDTDSFKHLYTNCATCGKKTEVRPKRNYKDGLEGYFCSKSCKTKYQWKDLKHREKVSTKNSEYMKKKWENPTEEMYEKVRKMNRVSRELIKEKKFWAQKNENLEILQKNIAKINQKLQKNRSSKEELELYKKVKSIFPTAKSQEILEKWCVDIFIPELNVNIEYDGGGHYLPVYTGKHTMESFLSKQEGRDIYLEKCGYHILRYSEIPSVDKIKEDVVRASKNYNSEYYFEDIKLISVKNIKNGKGGYKLYDITVEDDESFVVNGIISHNCRCKLAYLPKGWGFNEAGKIRFKGLDHDEYKEQRKEYGAPKEKEIKKAVNYEGKWHIETSDNHGDEHPENKAGDEWNHKVVHQAHNGKKFWRDKYMKWGEGEDRRLVSPGKLDSIQSKLAMNYASENGFHPRNTLAGQHLSALSKYIKSDPDRHLKVSGTGYQSKDRDHQDMRQRHLMLALAGHTDQWGGQYSITPVTHPETGEHTGFNIKAPRHQPSGDLFETSWHWDGKSLKTLYNKPTGKKWK